jgi:hypothetical protein
MLRRAAFASSVAVAGGLAAELAEPAPASAADGDPVKAGQETSADSTTVIYEGGNGYANGGLTVTDTLFVNVPADANYKQSAIAGIGLQIDGSGLQVGVAGYGAVTGVIGTAHGQAATGVFGSSNTGVGVRASSTSGQALKVSGRVGFSTAGHVSIGKGLRSVTVSRSYITTSSLVLATLQTADGAIAVANAVPGAGRFTIHLTAAATTPVKVAWFVIG